MTVCEYCGGDVASGCGPTQDLKTHYSKIDCAEVLKLQVREMTELLRQADDLYTGYGLICGPIKDFPKYEGKVHQGEWINKVRSIVRNSEKRKCDFKVDAVKFGRERCEHVIPCPMHG